MVHHCKYFIAHCIDFRLGRAIKDYLEENGLLGDCDIVSVAGAIKDSSLLLEQLDISVRLHNTREVILINHLDCGAYGGSGAFSSSDEEHKLHVEELKKAKKAVLAKYSSLKVRTVLAKIQPSGEVIFEALISKLG